VAKLAALQERLLDAAADLLKPGGRLVYSTCSLEKAEGEDQIAALLERRSDLRRDPIRPDELPGLSEAITAEGELRTFPFHLPDETVRLGGLDGFFAARLVRT
jgi:16S rRNA (cytosine967-C5)-methyltransferase